MLKTVLIGLDGSDYGRAAIDLGIRWAKTSDAMLVGLAVVNKDFGPEPVPLGGSAFKEDLDKKREHACRLKADQVQEYFSVTCSNAGVSSKPLEEDGTPVETIALQSQRYDLVMLGQRTFFSPGDDPEADNTLHDLLRVVPRPVVAVPKNVTHGNNVVVAYDGSLHAARAVHAFAHSGILQPDLTVHVVAVRNQKLAATKIAQRACEFLSFHDIRTTAHAIESNQHPGQVLLDQIKQLDAQLLVMGCFGQNAVREFFLGSATRSLVENSPVPLFLYH